MEVTNLDARWKQFLRTHKLSEADVDNKVKLAYYSAWRQSIKLFTNDISGFDSWPKKILLLEIDQQAIKQLMICRIKQLSDNCS